MNVGTRWQCGSGKDGKREVKTTDKDKGHEGQKQHGGTRRRKKEETDRIKKAALATSNVNAKNKYAFSSHPNFINKFDMYTKYGKRTGLIKITQKWKMKTEIS